MKIVIHVILIAVFVMSMLEAARHVHAFFIQKNKFDVCKVEWNWCKQNKDIDGMFLWLDREFDCFKEEQRHVGPEIAWFGLALISALANAVMFQRRKKK